MSPKADAEKATENKQVVFMVGESYGAHHGDRRSVSPDLAASLVENGLARYPDNYEG